MLDKNQTATFVEKASPEWADTREIAKILGLSPSYFAKGRVYGYGPPYAKFGAAVRYHVPTAKSWAAEKLRRSTSDVGAAA